MICLVRIGFAALVLLALSVDAFTLHHRTSMSVSTLSSSTTVLHETTSTTAATDISRRTFLSTVIAATAVSSSFAILPIQSAYAAADSKDALIADLQTSLTKIETIPSLVDSAEWDKIRTVLKTTPVVELWNLGESKNTLVKLAKETGEFDLMEMKDELAISLQMCDQYSYDNNFIYYQPGKYKKSLFFWVWMDGWMDGLTVYYTLLFCSYETQKSSDMHHLAIFHFIFVECTYASKQEMERSKRRNQWKWQTRLYHN